MEKQDKDVVCCEEEEEEEGSAGEVQEEEECGRCNSDDEVEDEKKIQNRQIQYRRSSSIEHHHQHQNKRASSVFCEITASPQHQPPHDFLPQPPRLPLAPTPAITKANDRFSFDNDDVDDDDEGEDEVDDDEAAGLMRAHAHLRTSSSTDEGGNHVTDGEAATSSDNKLDEFLSKVSDSRRASDCAKTIRDFAATVTSSSNQSEAAPPSPTQAPPPPQPTTPSEKKSGTLKRFNIKKHSLKGSSGGGQQQQANSNMLNMCGWQSLTRALARVGIEDYLSEEAAKDGSWRHPTTSILKSPATPTTPTCEECERHVEVNKRRSGLY